MREGWGRLGRGLPMSLSSSPNALYFLGPTSSAITGMEYSPWDVLDIDSAKRLLDL